MRRSVVALGLLLVAVLAPVGPAAAAQQRDPTRDTQAAAATADQLFQLAADRKFNALYDRIHPDAHAVVPRAAAVGTFEAVYAKAQAGRSRITGVDMGPWTWGVTGRRYDYAAGVHFQQPYVDDQGRQQTLTDTMYLVQDPKSNGEWRWFFGSSKQFVEQAIAKYGGRGTPLVQGDLLRNVVNDLDGFYRDALGYTQYKYYSPGVVVVPAGRTVSTGCGQASSGFWGFYCPTDQTLYLDQPLLIQLQQQGTPFAAAFVIAHEWAHHIQSGVGLARVEHAPTQWNQLYSIELELMADCFAGAWALDVDTRGLLGENDINDAIQFTINYLGDPAHTSAYDPQAHGTAEQRVQSFLSGYENGFLGCNVKL